MPNISIALSDRTYEELMARVNKTEKKNKSAVVEMLINSAGTLTLESYKLIDQHMELERIDKITAMNELIKLGYNYYHHIRPDLQKSATP